MKFFTYRQNNSGGSFDNDEKNGIGLFVVVEAESAKDADKRAEEIGLYFDGCDDGRDCSCCGDRWSRQWCEDDANDSPKLYGEPIENYDSWERNQFAFVHYANGSVVKHELKSES